MFAIDSLVFDLVLAADAQPSPEALVAALGGPEVAQSRLIVDVDLDAPQLEEISPTVPLRRRGERRLLVVDESVAPLRQNPRTDPIVARNLAPERDRLVALVEAMGARFGRLGAFGTWGDAVVVTRNPRDLRALMLLSWAIDPQTDLEGRRRANPLTQREFEDKLRAFDKRLDELDDLAVLGLVPPARLDRRKTLLVVDVISDRDGSWDIRKSYELERRVGAVDKFARIPGARTVLAEEPEPAPARAPTPVPAPAAPPPPAGPPIQVEEVDGRIVLLVPGDRFDLDLATALGRRDLGALRPHDAVTGHTRERAHEQGCGFVAPLAFLSEVFIEGRPLDRRRFESESQPQEGARALEAHLPRFGPVKVLEVAGKRYVTSETALPVPRLLPLLARL